MVLLELSKFLNTHSSCRTFDIQIPTTHNLSHSRNHNPKTIRENPFLKLNFKNRWGSTFEAEFSCHFHIISGEKNQKTFHSTPLQCRRKLNSTMTAIKTKDEHKWNDIYVRRREDDGKVFLVQLSVLLTITHKYGMFTRKSSVRTFILGWREKISFL